MIKSNQLSRFASAFALFALISSATVAHADDLVTIDLSVTDTVTLIATEGNSAITAAGSDGVGLYFADLLAGVTSGLSPVYDDGSGLFTAAEDAPESDGPQLWRAAGSTDSGLNVYSWTDEIEANFTAGSRAFLNRSSFTISSDVYASLVASGNVSGDIYFPADDVGDIAALTPLGTYTVLTVPEPGALVILSLGLCGVALLRRRR